MRNEHLWRPSKYWMHAGQLRSSRDRAELSPGSRLIGDINARAYQRLIPQHARGRLLDLGCGKVPLFELYEPLVDEVVCCDWPSSSHGNLHVDVLCDINTPLPFTDNAFDTILASDVIEHSIDPALLLREANRILSPGGKLLLNTPFLYWLHEVPFDYYRISGFGLRELARRAELDVVSVDAYGGAPHVLADIASKCFSRIGVLGSWIALALQSMAAIVPMQRSDTRFPLVHFAVAQKPSARRTQQG